MIVRGVLLMTYSLHVIRTVQYERLPALFRTVHIWRQVILSLILNWIIGPFVSAPSES
jgi:ACR3 family arsenite transporter